MSKPIPTYIKIAGILFAIGLYQVSPLVASLALFAIVVNSH